MGVFRLWECLEGLKRDVPLSQFRGRRIAVDAPNLIHHTARAFVMPLVEGNTAPVTAAVHRKLNALEKRFGVTFVLVFDGEDPPVKAAECASREAERFRYRSMGLELLRNHEPRLAAECFGKAPPVGRYVGNFIAQFREKGRECIVAPYEAEAELAFLSRKGHVAAIWTGDSDVVPFFAGLTIREIDLRSGVCQSYDFGSSTQWKEGVTPSLAQLQRPCLFVLACAAAGCDYTPFFHRDVELVASVVCAAAKSKGIGMESLRFEDALDAVASKFRFAARETLAVRQACFCLLHHWVVDPTSVAPSAARHGKTRTPKGAAANDDGAVDIVPNFPVVADAASVDYILEPVPRDAASSASSAQSKQSASGVVHEYAIGTVGPRRPVTLTPAVALIDERLPPLTQDDRRKLHAKGGDCDLCLVSFDSPKQAAEHSKSLSHQCWTAIRKHREEAARPQAAAAAAGGDSQRAAAAARGGSNGTATQRGGGRGGIIRPAGRARGRHTDPTVAAAGQLQAAV